MLDLLGFILGSCLLMFIAGFTAFLCFGFVFLGCFEGEKFAPLKYTVTFFCGIVLIACVGLLGFHIYKAVNPPETVVKNGITYHLVDDSPEEKIKEYGHDYVIGGEKND